MKYYIPKCNSKMLYRVKRGVCQFITEYSTVWSNSLYGYLIRMDEFTPIKRDEARKRFGSKWFNAPVNKK